jgi:DNA-binding HxlR family transcriptional regulator
VEGLLEVIRRRYSLAVMGVVRARERARYHEIEAALPKASSSTLAETLRALELARLVEREAGEAGAHHSYRLTRSGDRLLRRLRGLLTEVQAS